VSECKKLESLIANWESARVEALRAEVARLTACLRYEQHLAERIGTHGPHCKNWGPAHYECAMSALTATEEQLMALRDAAVGACFDDNGYLVHPDLAKVLREIDAASGKAPT
jgi:hypothetical protein